MTDILEQEKFSELLHEYGETPEVQKLVGEFFAPEMLSKEIGTLEVKQYFERVRSLLLMLEKDDAVKYNKRLIN